MSEVPQKSSSSINDRFMSDEQLRWLGEYEPRVLPPADSAKTAETGDTVRSDVKNTMGTRPEKK